MYFLYIFLLYSKIKEDDKMAIDINKHEVEIDTLFKQNENDLCSIKELYRKLKEFLSI